MLCDLTLVFSVFATGQKLSNGSWPVVVSFRCCSCWFVVAACLTFKGRALERLGLKHHSDGFVVLRGGRLE